MPHIQSRAIVRDRYALMPLSGFPPSRLPRWQQTEARILAAPSIGAAFVQMFITVQAGGGVMQPPDDMTESFLYILTGGVDFTLAGHRVRLSPGGFAFIPHDEQYELKAVTTTTLLLLRKRFEPLAGVIKPEPLTGNEANVPADAWMGNEHTRLQTLLPDELNYDMAMNIFTFDSGHGLPYVETHVMEHGLYFLSGEGDYLLGDEWMKVQPADFIWMGPYCPQYFMATGTTPSRYIYYKNVNRDISLQRRGLEVGGRG